MPRDIVRVPGLTVFKLVNHPDGKWDTFVKQQWRSVPITPAVQASVFRHRWMMMRITGVFTFLFFGMAIGVLICFLILKLAGVFQ